VDNLFCVLVQQVATVVLVKVDTGKQQVRLDGAVLALLFLLIAVFLVTAAAVFLVILVTVLVIILKRRKNRLYMFRTFTNRPIILWLGAQLL